LAAHNSYLAASAGPPVASLLFAHRNSRGNPQTPYGYKRKTGHLAMAQSPKEQIHNEFGFGAAPPKAKRASERAGPLVFPLPPVSGKEVLTGIGPSPPSGEPAAALTPARNKEAPLCNRRFSRPPREGEANANQAAIFIAH